MGFSAIARIEHYKHYQAGAIHKEAVRELTGYSNPNWNPDLVSENVYFERMVIDKPFEKWVYDFRKEYGIVGRYIENSSNPKNETNAMCQALYTLPGYINTLSKDEQLKALKYCFEFHKSEFPGCPILEAVCHFDEVSPHLQVNFIPIVCRKHNKRGYEYIFSTTLLMPGVDFFPKFQDRFFAYMESVLEVELERKKGSRAKHLSPKEYRAVTAELQALEAEKIEVASEVESVKEEFSFWENQLKDLQSSSAFDKTLKLYERIRDLERENKLLKSFFSYLSDKVPFIDKLFERFKHSFTKSRGFEKN